MWNSTSEEVVMAATKASPLLLLLALAFLALGALVLARAPAASLPSLTLPAAPPAAQQAARAGGILADLDLDVAGAEEHAVARHGQMAHNILDMARAGQCTTIYLACGADPHAPADGTKGYLICPLAGGGLGLVPFYVDALLHRLVAMTAYVVQPGYERYVTERDGCVPVDFIVLLSTLEDDYADH
jgi:hypothetical protein